MSCVFIQDMKGWEVYASNWGCADWTIDDVDWEIADECTWYVESMEYLYWAGPRSIYYAERTNGSKQAFFYNDAAIPIWISLRFTSQPEDLRLVNCARKIKKAFRKASNDPSYKMCRQRLLTLLYS